MIELLVGFGIASWMGAGGTYIVLLLFALSFPRLFRVFYWMLMFPIMAIGSALIGWLIGGFFFGWSESTASVWLLLGSVFGFLFCSATDPKQG